MDMILRHVPLDIYIAMMLGNKAYRKNLEDDLFEALLNKCGSMPGISKGSIYYIPELKAARIAQKDERDIKIVFIQILPPRRNLKSW